MTTNLIGKRSKDQQHECDHPESHGDSIAGIRRERCTACGKVTISFERPARTGVLFSIPRDGERGAALAEWGLLVVLVAVVALIAVSFTGQQVSGEYDHIATTLTSIGA